MIQGARRRCQVPTRSRAPTATHSRKKTRARELLDNHLRAWSRPSHGRRVSTSSTSAQSPVAQTPESSDGDRPREKPLKRPRAERRTRRRSRNDEGAGAMCANPLIPLVAGLDLNQRPLGYELFPNRDWSNEPQTTRRKISVSHGVALGLVGSNFLGKVWVAAPRAQPGLHPDPARFLRVADLIRHGAPGS